MSGIPRQFSRMRLTSGALLALLPFFAAPVATGQNPSMDEIKLRLTGSGTREWVLKKWSVYLGSDRGCKSGEIWRFAKNGHVDIWKCVRGRTVRDTKPWLLRKENDLDYSVIVGQQVYTVLFPPPKPGSAKEEMILRIVSKEKTRPTISLIFSYERD